MCILDLALANLWPHAKLLGPEAEHEVCEDLLLFDEALCVARVSTGGRGGELVSTDKNVAL